MTRHRLFRRDVSLRVYPEDVSPVATIFSGENVFRVTIEKGEGGINREGSFCEVDWYTRDRCEQWSTEREGRVLWPCPRWTGWFRGRNRYFGDDDRVQRVRDGFLFSLYTFIHFFERSLRNLEFVYFGIILHVFICFELTNW